MAAMKVVCGRTGQEDELFEDDEDNEEQTVIFDQDDHASDRPFYWTRHLQNSFRQELEKYVQFLMMYGQCSYFLRRLVILGMPTRTSCLWLS